MFEDIKSFIEKEDIPFFRYKQLESAVYTQSKIDFDQINMYPKVLREKLKENFKLLPLTYFKKYVTNQSIKFVLKTEDEYFIEVVLILHNDSRKTVCVSSQIFCPLNCKFCATGANKFIRSLNYKEIVSQVLFVNNYLKNDNKRVTNIVFMGQGEPFLNYDNVIKSIDIINTKLKIGTRHILISTVGIPENIIKLAKYNKQIKLAISLHCPNNKLRDYLMPINKKYSLEKLFSAIDDYIKITNKKVSFEYVLIKDVNDNVSCANQLINLLKNRLSYVNLLIYNEHEFSDFKKPNYNKVNKFKKILESANIDVSIRKSIGDEVSSACGQLSGKIKK